MTRNDSEKASTLLKYFSSVFTNEPDEPFEELSEVCSDQLDDIEISVQRVKEVIDQTNINKSPGPDSIHPRILKEAGHMLALPLTLIFRESLDTGQLPKDWKTAHLSAIHKKGSKSHPNNYRPVSLTSVACKLLEKIIRSDMIDHLKRRDLHSNRQYGFIEGRSTVLQLLTVLDIWTETLDQGENIDIIYCDFKKAFDKVPQQSESLRIRRETARMGRKLSYQPSSQSSNEQPSIRVGASHQWNSSRHRFRTHAFCVICQRSTINISKFSSFLVC